MKHHTDRIVRAGTPLLLALLMLYPAQARAHETGVLKPATKQLAAGDSLAIAGEKFTKNSPLELFLVGINGRTRLGEIEVDSTGRFATRMLVPTGVASGGYRLVAVALDGDEVATVDVAVSVAESGHAMGEHAEMPMAMPDEPTSQSLGLERASNPVVTWSVVAGILAMLTLGGVLLRPNRSA